MLVFDTLDTPNSPPSKGEYPVCPHLDLMPSPGGLIAGLVLYTKSGAPKKEPRVTDPAPPRNWRKNGVFYVAHAVSSALSGFGILWGAALAQREL